MRILMMTDDGPSIDRRILLQAEALSDQGHEVILLARHVEGKPGGERIGSLKVEYVALDRYRLAHPSRLNFLKSFFLQSGHFVVDNLGEGSRRIVKKIWLWLSIISRNPESYINRELGRVGDGWIPAQRRMVILARLAIVVVFGAALILARNLAAGLRGRHRPQHALSRPGQPSVWDAALINRAIFYDPDLIHVHDLPQLVAGVKASKALKIPLVYDAHELYPEIATLTPAEQAYLRMRENMHIRKADALITVNPFIAQLMQDRYRTKRVTVITNATRRLTELDHSPNLRLFHEKLRLADSVQILCYQGWFAKEGRGLVELVEAVASVRNDVHLVMLGYGDIPFFKELAEAVGVADRVHILPAVPWDELLLWSASADVGIIPYQPIDLNHENCSPNKLFEFIAARLPILANDLKYLKLVVEGEGFGLVRPLSTPENMAAAINEMFNPVEGHVIRSRQAMIDRGARWEWPVEAEKLLQLYDGVMAKMVDPSAARKPVFKKLSISAGAVN
jgi:glycosyltransferase involved in cell wall biosynthesis